MTSRQFITITKTAYDKINTILRENKKIRNALVKQIKAAHIKSKSKKK